MPRPTLHPDRFFDPDPSIRRVARQLYEETRGLPIVSPHGHVDPRILADNEPFPDPAALIVAPDHYVLRMLYARGVPLEALGVPRLDGAPVERGGAVAAFRVEDLEGTMVALKDRGIEVAHQGEVEGYGRFALFPDPDGNRVELYCDMVEHGFEAMQTLGPKRAPLALD